MAAATASKQIGWTVISGSSERLRPISTELVMFTTTDLESAKLVPIFNIQIEKKVYGSPGVQVYGVG